MKLLTAALLTASTLFASASYAIDTPMQVYKVSFQPPETVFNAGFVSPGHDRDLIRYVSGVSTGDEHSGYISTLEWIVDATSISEATARRNPERPIYIYEIRPTENFFNVGQSILQAWRVLPPGAAREQVNDLYLATRHWSRTTWAASAAIAGDQIYGARRYYWNNGQPHFGPRIVNPNYYYLPPESSRGPMPVRNATVDAAEVADDAHNAGFVPAAVVDMACNAQPRRLAASQTPLCPPVESLSFSTLHSRTIAKLIANGILMGSTSGQLLSVPGHDEL
ncbi:hypothetical protein CGLAMM_08175 [Acetobacteraceae bacterium EV16G]|uniref:Pertussis toxin subunit 1 n=1 Tax=Sorlinia euscelidii TaxID=3081148 RepID=A0ABU7U2U0_9PROT